MDRNSAGFNSTSKATASFTADTSATRTQSTKFQAARGYSIDLGSTERVFQTLIPYLATNISLTDTQGKPRTIAPYNFVAGGLMLTQVIDGRHFFTLMPQYVDLTTQRAQLASIRAIYAPWTKASESRPLLPLNTPIPLNDGDQFFPMIAGQLLFDLRADIGTYTKSGDPAFAPQNRGFDRFGTRFGLAFSTSPSNLPTYTISATEMLLYGVAGSIRGLHLFDTALTVSFDPHGRSFV